MKRFLHRALILLGLLSCAAMAQQPDQGNTSSGQTQSADQSTTNRQPRRRGSAFQRQRQHMAMLAQKLNLTDAQKQQFQQISQNMFRQAMAIRHDSSLTEDQKKEKIQALRRQSHQEMFGVLTPEQKDRLKQMREQHQREQGAGKTPGERASAQKKPGAAANDDDDPFAGMTSDDDDGPGNGGGF